MAQLVMFGVPVSVVMRLTEVSERSEAKRSEAKRASLLEDEHTRDEVREMVLDGRFDSPKDAPGQTRERVHSV